jgi:hypothetical protein
LPDITPFIDPTATISDSMRMSYIKTTVTSVIQLNLNISNLSNIKPPCQGWIFRFFSGGGVEKIQGRCKPNI